MVCMFLLSVLVSYPIGIPVALLVLLFRRRRALDDTCDVACAACNASELENPTSEFVPVFHEAHLQHELSAREPREFLRKGLHMPNAVCLFVCSLTSYSAPRRYCCMNDSPCRMNSLFTLLTRSSALLCCGACIISS